MDKTVDKKSGNYGLGKTDKTPAINMNKYESMFLEATIFTKRNNVVIFTAVIAEYNFKAEL